MGAYKQFLASDIVVTPFTVNKSFTFQGIAALTGSNVGIERLLGQNITSSLFSSASEATTGLLGPQFQRLVYRSIRELYYSNYLSSSYGDVINQMVLLPGSTPEGDTLIASSSGFTTPSYDNYLQTTLSYSKFYPTASDSIIGVISIPTRLFGDYIKPNTFVFKTDSGSLTDDGEGNILLNSNIVGNIFYPHGIVTITGNGNAYVTASIYGTASYGTSVYGGSTFADETLNFITSSNVTCSFLSTYTIHETQYKCTIRENEFSFTLNPSITSGSTSMSSSIGIFSTPSENVYGYVTESYFSPYITTVGLYDESQNLLAVAKLAQPLPSSPTTDTTILISLDR
jgi:hypothetical protein